MICYKSKLTGRWNYLDKEQVKFLIVASVTTVQVLLVSYFVWLPIILGSVSIQYKLLTTVPITIFTFGSVLVNWFTMNIIFYAFDLIKKKITTGDK